MTFVHFGGHVSSKGQDRGAVEVLGPYGCANLADFLLFIQQVGIGTPFVMND